MLSPLRQGLVAALLIGCQSVSVSAQTSVSPTVTVQQLAPQLVTFAGSQANFQNLVTGLAQGTQVQLFSVLPDGSTQVASFTPAAPVPVAQIPSLLESTRQQLIGLGVATPTAQQLALALTGGTVPTALGAGENRPSPAAQTQSHATAAAASAEAATRVNTSDTPLAPGATSRSPVPPTPTPASSAGATAAHSPLPAAAGVGARSHAR